MDRISIEEYDALILAIPKDLPEKEIFRRITELSDRHNWSFDEYNITKLRQLGLNDMADRWEELTKVLK